MGSIAFWGSRNPRERQQFVFLKNRTEKLVAGMNLYPLFISQIGLLFVIQENPVALDYIYVNRTIMANPSM